jgi:acyl carrier protein
VKTTRERIKALLLEHLPAYQEKLPLLIQLDSLAIIQLVNALEREFDVQITASELDPSVFETVDSLTALMDRKNKLGLP